MEKIIHQIWIGPYEIPNREKRCIDLVKTFQSDYSHILWTNNNIPDLPVDIKNIYDYLGSRKDYAHQADLLRIFLIHEYGGVYMDVDFEFKSGISSFNLENYDGFFCSHFGNLDTFPNGIFGLKKNHGISKYLLEDAIENFPKKYWYGPSWLANNIKQYFGIDYEISHNDFEKYFDNSNIYHINYDVFHVNHYWHHALYSWSPENRQKFEDGTIYC